jgi:hypothetical protein
MATYYHITVEGHLEGGWTTWFEGLTITNVADGTAVLAGSLRDQTALHGVLLKIRDLGLPLLAVQPLARPAKETANSASAQGESR